MKQHQAIEDQPWHQNYMVWMIILLPATVVVAGLMTVYIAMQNAPQVIDQTPVTTAVSAAHGEG